MSGDEACAYGLIDRVVRQHEVTPKATGKSDGGGQRR
jgi:ATP-dependent protease ClpP protease subunit